MRFQLKPGTFVHTLAVMLSSLASIVVHPVHAGITQSKFSKKQKKQKEDVSLRVEGPVADPPGSGSAERYPWKRSIVTTTFWVGEKPAKNNPVPNHISCWDAQWAKNFGGTDDPDRAQRSDYAPAGFTPRQNPFYVALPYNDKLADGHKPEAPLVIPWFREAYAGPAKSVCKGRWIAIRNPVNNRICFAQWEDAGPFRTDHWQYVFGGERPKPNMNRGAGLDVSPAVRDFLGMNDTDVTDWKFVEFDEVPQGPWAKLGDNNTFVMNRREQDDRLAMAKPVPRVILNGLE